MILWFIAAIVILLTVSVLAFVLPSFGLSKIDNKTTWKLGEQIQKLPSDAVTSFTGWEKSTFRIFFYLKSLPRTGVSADDNTLSASKFNPTTGTFDICELSTTSACEHPGFLPLLSLGNGLKLELLQVPDASRPGLPKAQCVIKTIKNRNSSTNANFMETFSLPAFPMQKWVMVTIVRQGSHFNIFYNDELVSSFQTTNVPDIKSESGFLADPRILGVAKYVKVTNQASSISDVVADHKNTTDTRGEPIEPILGGVKLSLCPSGDCFRGPEVKPANPYLSWETEYM